MIRVGIVVSAFTMSSAAVLGSPGTTGHHHDEEAAYGRPGDPRIPSRVIEVTMREDGGKMLFSPNRIVIKRGEQIRFRVVNRGALDHEMTVATMEENRKHKIQMEKHPDMEHDDPNAVRVTPDRTGEILWRFTKAGEFEFVCLIPGHYEAGMKGTIVVR